MRRIALVAFIGLMIGSAGSAHAAPIGKVFSVNKTGDHLQGGCTAADCTLREAVRAANAHPGPDAITLGARTYRLALPGTDEDDGLDGDLDVRGAVTITGKGAKKTTIDGGGPLVHETAFDVFQPGQVSIVAVTVRDSTGGEGSGVMLEAGAALAMRGARVIDNHASSCCAGISLVEDAALTLRHVRVANNTAPACCSGINGFAPGQAGPVVLDHVLVAGNGGNCCNGVTVSGPLRATRTTIRDNFGENCCQGLYTGAGRVSLSHVTVANNDDANNCCNGIQLGSGDAVMSDVRVVGNSGPDSGNGCCNGLELGAGDLTLHRGLVAGNGGGCCNGIQGEVGPAAGTGRFTDLIVRNNSGFDCCQGIESNSSAMRIARATISGNTDSTNCCTGVTVDADGPLSLRNATISGNSTAAFGAALSTSGPATLNNVTITRNVADSDGIGDDNGGAIRVGAGAVSIQNSIVAGNSLGGGGTGPDCFGTLTSGGHNLIGDTAGCTIAASGGNLLDVAARLGPLRRNGGFAPSHSLRRGSPAIDAGSPKRPGSGGGACERRDQRGVMRPQGRRCDIGAYERKVRRR